MRSISVSEIKAFSKCPRSHFYSYLENLSKRSIEVAPDTGSMGHAYLEAYYSGKDKLEALSNFTANMVKEKQPLATEEYNQIKECQSVVQEIMPRYMETYREDTFTPVATELRFDIEVPEVGVKFIGYIDAIVKDQKGDLWAMEHKFPQKSFRQEEDLQLDTQTALYQWACYELGYPIIGTIYNQILAKKFTVPQLVDKGKRLSKVAIYCDWETYSRCILALGQNLSDYEDMQEKLKPEIARRYYIYRSKDQIDRFMDEVFMKIEGIGRFHYMNESPMNCNSCMFRKLCVATLQGGDVKGIIETEYQLKGSRDKPAQSFIKDNNDGEEEVLL